MKDRRQTRGQQSLLRNPPTSEEAARLHSMYLKYTTSATPTDGILPVPMEHTLMENTMQMYPQQRKCVPLIPGTDVI